MMEAVGVVRFCKSTFNNDFLTLQMYKTFLQGSEH